MKLPRWLVVSLLSVSLLAAFGLELLGGWLWVTWPERTAREFVEVMGSMRYEELPRFFNHKWLESSEWDNVVGSPSEGLRVHARTYYTLEEKPFTAVDYVCGNRQYIVGNLRRPERYLMTVSRGTVIDVDFQMRSTFHLSPSYPITVWLFLADQSRIQRQL